MTIGKVILWFWFIMFSLIVMTKVWADPDVTISIPNDFQSGQVAVADQVDANFTEVKNKFDTHDHGDLAISGQVQGDIIYFNGTNWVRLAPGTSGLFLRTNGAGANPSYETPTDVKGILQVFKNTSGGAPATTSTSFVDIPASTVTLTTSSGSETLAEFEASGLIGGTAEVARIQLVIDGTAEEGTERYSQQVANGYFFVRTSTNKPLSAGSHTIKAQWRSHNGQTINLNGHEYVLRVVEYSK